VSDVELTREGPVATLTLNRPERRNALDPGLLIGLADEMDRLDDDPGIRVIVVTGAGTAFSAGADVRWMQASRDLSAEANRADAASMYDAFDRIDRCGTAVIARVNGAAVGGGAGLVACADVAVAAPGVRFAFAEARLGIIPAMISPFVLRTIGPGHTRALFTTARTFDATEAMRIGLVHRVAENDGLDAAVAEEATSMLACGPGAIAAAKRLIRDSTAAWTLPDLPERIAAIRTTEEGREGIAAFLEKREPRWSTSSDS
jgi:methylglutaconyl-CoA hydratase